MSVVYAVCGVWFNVVCMWCVVCAGVVCVWCVWSVWCVWCVWYMCGVCGVCVSVVCGENSLGPIPNNSPLWHSASRNRQSAVDNQNVRTVERAIA